MKLSLSLIFSDIQRIFNQNFKTVENYFLKNINNFDEIILLGCFTKNKNSKILLKTILKKISKCKIYSNICYLKRKYLIKY